MTHLAAQYLAAAGISFLEKQEDDSHTSLKFSVNDLSLHTYPLNEKGDTLSFDYSKFSLRWNSIEGNNTKNLNWCSHKKILEWISDQATKAGIQKEYKYKLHYQLPYSIINDFVFEISDRNSLTRLSKMRTLGQLSLNSFLKRRGLKTEVRTWPHHFDTGAYVASISNEENLSLGVGLAIPDEVYSDFYFYMAFYDDNGSIDTKGLPYLKIGTWSNKEFKGAILPVKAINNEREVVSFLEQSFDIFLHKYPLNQKK